MPPGSRHACSAALDRMPDGAGLLVIEHRAEIAHVRAAATGVNAATFWPRVRLASRKLLPRKGGSALIQVARSRAAEL